jgi:hypothetical protein
VRVNDFWKSIKIVKLVFVVLVAYDEIFKRLLNRSFTVIIILFQIRRNKKFLVNKDKSDLPVVRIYSCLDVALRKSRSPTFILVDHDVTEGLKNIFYKIIDSNHAVNICIADQNSEIRMRD